MVTVTYENTETNQKLTIKLTPSGEDSASVAMEFEPAIKETTEDPFGILGSLLDLFGKE